MATTRKTFTDNSVLTAADVNSALNPKTADHIPFGVASVAFSFSLAAASNTSVTVNMPAGRFTVAPSAWATCGSSQFIVAVSATTINTVTVDIMHRAGTNQTGTWYGAVLAVQMTPTTGNG